MTWLINLTGPGPTIESAWIRRSDLVHDCLDSRAKGNPTNQWQGPYEIQRRFAFDQHLESDEVHRDASKSGQKRIDLSGRTWLRIKTYVSSTEVERLGGGLKKEKIILVGNLQSNLGLSMNVRRVISMISVEGRGRLYAD